MEAILLAGGKGERLGDAAQGRPKSLVPIADRPLAAYQVAMLAAAAARRSVRTVLARVGMFGGSPAGLADGLALVLRFTAITRRSPPAFGGQWFPRSPVSPDGRFGG